MEVDRGLSESPGVGRGFWVGTLQMAFVIKEDDFGLFL